MGNVTDAQRLAERFEASRPRLGSVARRILGSPVESEDALQESWLRVSRADVSNVENVDAWLTTVVARVCLDALKRRASRREELIPDDPRGETATQARGERPEAEAVLADSIGVALSVLLDTLGPAERVAFVLHDMFDVPFEEIAPIVDRTTEAARQLASRARRRIRGTNPLRDEPSRHSDELVRAFFAASRGGNLAALIRMLDPNARVTADSAVLAMGGARYFGNDLETGISGAETVARSFLGRARAARHAFIDGVPAGAWVHEGRLMVLFRFTIAQGRIATIDLVADPLTLARVVLE